MSDLHLYKFDVWCDDENDWIPTSDFSEYPPTECPNNSNHNIGKVIVYDNLVPSLPNEIYIPLYDSNRKYIRTKSDKSWNIASYYWYDGSKHVGNIKRFLLTVSNTNDSQGIAELFIIGTITTLATLTWSSGNIEYPEKVETTSINNVPTEATLLGIRFKRNGGSNKYVNIHTITLTIST